MVYRDGYIVKNPLEIGGRSTNVSQIAYSIARDVKLAFPINGVPSEYVKALVNLTQLLEVAERQIEYVCTLLREPVDDQPMVVGGV